MNQEEILTQLNDIFRTVFDDKSIVAKREMTAEDVERWDSLSHVDMIVMVEEHFGIRIPSWQVANLKNVGDLVDIIIAKANS